MCKFVLILNIIFPTMAQKKVTKKTLSSPGITPLPDPFIESMKALHIPEVNHLFAALDAPPSIGLRFNSRKPSDINFVDSRPVEWCPVGIRLKTRAVFTLMPELHAGAFYVQDPSSMIHREIIRRIAPAPVTLLDLCAAPGGKTTAAIDALPEGSVVIANEFDSVRATALKENLIKWGYPHVAVTNADTSVFRSLRGRVDIVIADVPCSGEGMMRKDAVARSQWSENLIHQCAAIQWEIASNAIQALRPGGFLVYSTCTFNPVENEQMVQRLVDRFGLECIDLNLPAEWGILPSLSNQPAMRFMPHKTDGEGLFVAVMRTPEAHSELTQPQFRLPKGHYSGLEKEFIIDADKYLFRQTKNRLEAISPRLIQLLDLLPTQTKVLMSGVEIGETKGKDFIPSAQLALSSALRKEYFPHADLSKSEALSFLRREPLVLQANAPKGITLVSYDGLPLGWVKNIGLRANNLYPQKWKIRL